MLAAALATGLVAAAAAATPTEVTALAMHWFTEMQAGRADRSEYTPAYAAQVTDEAVAGMSRALDRYGAAPLRAEIMQTRRQGQQIFYVVRFVFPRGDATALLFGLDPVGKLTGVGVAALAGD